MAFILINSFHLKPALDDFLKLLVALVGPHGKKCLMSSPVDSITLTSSSKQVIENMSVGSPVLEFILQSMKSQTERFGDGGLYCGIILSKLVLSLVDCSFPLHTACSILAEFKCITQAALQSSAQLCMKVNLDSIQPLITVAQSVLFSKCGIYEGKNLDAVSQANTQVTLLVKAFLQSESSIKKVVLNVCKNSNRQYLFDGVLYQCSDEEHVVLKSRSWHSVSILLFSVMLTDKLDCQDKELPGVENFQRGRNQFEAAQLFIEKAISLGIQVIACQKVVHPLLILKLRRAGILVLQRLGKQKTEVVEMLSGAIAISSLDTCELDLLPTFKGHLKSVRYLGDFTEDFVLLEGNSNSGICSLMLSSRSLESGAELKVVAHQVLAALNQVLQDAAVLPGGGCTEVYLCCLLWEKVQKGKKDLCAKLKCSASQLDSVMRWLQEGLLVASGLDCKTGKLAVDSVFHHAWKGSHDKNSIVDLPGCNCGLVTSNTITQLKGSWTLVTLDHFESFFSSAQELSFVPTLSGFSSVLDVCTTKRSALGLAIDNSIAITNIGAIITQTDFNM